MQVQFSQRDPKWANQRLGWRDGVTVGQAGCYVNTFANIASHLGKDIDTGRLDDIFSGPSPDKSLYFPDTDQPNQPFLCTDDMLEKVYPDIKFIEVFHFEGVPADFSVLVNTWEDEYAVELDSDPNQSGVQTHFNRFWSYENGKLLILDSWTGQIVDVAEVYGDPVVAVQKIVHYRGPVKSATPITEVPPLVATTPTLPDPHDIVVAPQAPETPVSPVEAPRPVEPTTTPTPTITPPLVDNTVYFKAIIEFIKKLFSFLKRR